MMTFPIRVFCFLKGMGGEGDGEDNGWIVPDYSDMVIKTVKALSNVTKSF